MPADFVIKTGDFLKITVFPPAIVPTLMAPIPLIGTSTNAMVNSMPVCLEGDELPPMLLAPQAYTAPPFTIPGMLMVKVNLLPTNKTMLSKNGKPMLIKGTPFQVELSVIAPALMPPPVSTPDAAMKKMALGEFITTNVTVQAG